MQTSFPLDQRHVQRGYRRILASAFLALSGLAGLLPAEGHAATTYNITTTSMDTVNGDGLCTLPEAVQSAQSNATFNECVSAGGPYTINLQSNAIYTATTVGNFDTQFGNSAFQFNGSQPLIINGNGSTLTQSGQMQRIFLNNGGNVTMRNLTITGGNAVLPGLPFGEWGGAILAVFPGAVMNLEDVTITNNQVGQEGAGMYVVAQAIANLHRVTVSNNEAAGGTGTAFQIRVDQVARMNIANSTFDGAARSLALTSTGTAALASNVTLRSGSGVAVDIYPGTTLTLQNSIVHGECSANGGAYTLINLATNLPSCSPTLPLPVLSALGAYGGSTRTIVPGLPNASKDAASGCAYASAGTNPLFANGALITTDQRGFPRDANCDIGAVEAMTISPSTLPAGIFGVPYTTTISQTGGGAPVTFAVTVGALPAGLSLDANTGVISGTPTAAGAPPFTITVTDSGGFTSDHRYQINIARADQTITFNAQTTATRPFVASGTFAINPLATASSGLTPTYVTLTGAVCGVSGTTVTMFTAGTCTIRAQQAGSANYNAAPTVNQSINITPGVQTLTFNAQSTASQTFVAGGTFAINPVATTNAGAPSVVHSSLTPAVCTVTGTTVTMASAGTCTLRASHVGNGNYQPAVSGTQDVTINPGVQVIAFTAPSPKALGELPFVVSAVGGASGNPVTFTTLTPGVCAATGSNGTTITLLVAGTCTLRAAQAGNANYAAAASVDRSFLVGSGTSIVLLDSSANPATYLSPVTLTARVGGVAPSGTARFKNGATTLCEAAVSNGMATCTVQDLLEGAHGIRVEYLGDGNNLPSFSAELIQRIRKVGIHQGAWWGGPQENGWGLSIMEQGDTLVAGWYYFDASGRPTWLILPGCSWNANKTVCSGTLQRATSSWFGDYRANDVRLVPVGTATFTFNSADLGRFDYTVDGVNGSKSISRLDLGGNPLAPFDLTNVWWGGLSQNGWGLSLFVAGPTLAGVWYTYDTQGQPTWVLFNGGEWQNPSRYRSQLSRLTGSPMIGATYDVNQLRLQPAGEMYFEFTDYSSGRMVYLIDGLLQVKDISKQRF